MSGSEYVIVGDTERYKGCLVCVCGENLERAKIALERMLNNPTGSDKAIIKGHKNLRIEKTAEEECWWRNGAD